MRINKLIIALIFQVLSLHGQDYSQKYGKPIITLYEADPSFDAENYNEIGLDAPTFVMYDNGQLLFRKLINKKIVFFEYKVEQRDIKKFLKKVGITEKFLKDTPQYINATEISCQAFTTLSIRLDSTKRTTISGNIHNKKSRDRKQVPKNIMAVFDNLFDYNTKLAKQWTPDYIEVTLTDDNDFAGTIIQLPKEFVNLDTLISKDTVGLTYKVFIGRKYFKEFYELMKEAIYSATVIHNRRNIRLMFKLKYPNLD